VAANPGTRPRDALPEYSMQMSIERFDRWYGAGRVNSPYPLANRHIDSTAAQQEGLPAPVAGGPDVANLIFRSLAAFFGEGWFAGGDASLTIVRPTYAADFLTAKGHVVAVELEGDSLRIRCDVWVEDGKGEKKVVGRASGKVPLE
jgi:hypothetical protein